MDEFEKLLLEYQSGTLQSNSGNFTLFEALISKYRSMTCKMVEDEPDWTDNGGKIQNYTCDKCKEQVDDYIPNYCPNCGRKVVK